MMRSDYKYLIPIIIAVVIAIWIIWPNNPGINIAGFQKEIETRLGLDLVGGVQALLEADLPENTAIEPEAMRTATRIVENRVNGLGVTEAVVQQAGDRRIVVELPGETDPESALATLKQTGLLEFVDFSGLSPQEVYSLTNQEIQTDFGQDNNLVPSVETPADIGVGSEIDLSSLSNRVYHTVMTGADLKSVQVVTSQTGEYQVAFELTPNGSNIFRDFTSQNVGESLAIILDNKVISAPVINEPITDGRGVITGNFDYDTSNALAIQLRYGSLPIPLKIVETRTVGPTLGQDSLQKSLIAGVVGFTIVILFMGLYYRLPGLVADVAIILYAIFAFALFRFIPITLTLPGVAGFLLSTGAALDANILIFERFKEELRSGKPIQQSLLLGWKRAWPSIRDSNIATLITCAILFWFGSTFGATIVKGFSLTLALGVIVSLFTALVITRALLNLAINTFKPKNFVKWYGI
ncbi:MAG: protein translocase subunit SecD [Anaerolineales bacterium]|jgi:preprotein translocase subunit SecD